MRIDTEAQAQTESNEHKAQSTEHKEIEGIDTRTNRESSATAAAATR